MRRLAGTLGLCLLATAGEARGGAPHPGFVYLADVAPTIGQDMRYAGSHNFIGRPVDGYEANECILTGKAAQALARVQSELTAHGLSLIVWDCYRPARAVRDFVNWSKNPADARMKAEFFPNTDKANFFQQGYLAARSAHSRGSTVDLGIVRNSTDKTPPKFDPAAPLKPCTAAKGERFEDGTIDLGTEHDCLDPQASTMSPIISKEARENRLWLKGAMQRAGFKPYAKEWWHFELVEEPFPQQSFDFAVVARTGTQNEKPRAEPAKGQEPPSIGSQWTEFRHAVLKRQVGVVASMTKFRLAHAAELLDEPAFLEQFDSIFNGDITGCIALRNPEQNQIGKNTYNLTCSTGGKRKVLHFQIINGNWRLFAIESENNADGKDLHGVEQSPPNAERVPQSSESPPPKTESSAPNADGSLPKATRSTPKAARGLQDSKRKLPNSD